MARLLIGEAQVLAHIGHRNVVRYLGSGIVASGPEAGTPFVATELIDGPSLAERIGQAPQDPRWSARILAQVADALDFVHQLKTAATDGRGRARIRAPASCIATSSRRTSCWIEEISRY